MSPKKINYSEASQEMENMSDDEDEMEQIISNQKKLGLL